MLFCSSTTRISDKPVTVKLLRFYNSKVVTVSSKFSTLLLMTVIILLKKMVSTSGKIHVVEITLWIFLISSYRFFDTEVCSSNDLQSLNAVNSAVMNTPTAPRTPESLSNSRWVASFVSQKHLGFISFSHFCCKLFSFNIQLSFTFVFFFFWPCFLFMHGKYRCW